MWVFNVCQHRLPTRLQLPLSLSLCKSPHTWVLQPKALKSSENKTETNQSVSRLSTPRCQSVIPNVRFMWWNLGNSRLCVRRDSNMERFSIFHDLVRTFLNLTSVTHSRCSCKRDVLWGSLFLELSLQFHAHVVCCRFDERRFDAGWKLEWKRCLTGQANAGDDFERELNTPR